ncbi:MAG: LTA synthase family protein [Clostridia bacterium]|nr:LTA synthase family protein [Clostridia bacterium]
MNSIKKYIKKHSLPMIFIILMNFALIVAVEWFWRKDIHHVITWITQQFPLVLMNLAFVMLVTLILALILKRYTLAFLLVTNFVLILGLLNSKKIALRNVPLVTSDFHLFNEAMNLLPQFADKKTIMLVILGLILMVGLSYFIIKWSKRLQPFKLPHMLPLIIIATFTLIIGQISYGNETSIIKSGLLISIVNDAKRGTEQTIHYDVNEDDLIPTDNKGKLDPNHEGIFKSDQKPNVIIIQSEAFWDPNKLNLTFSENPIKNFNALEKQSMHGYMYVPVFGGGTSNTEFEVLTGMSLKNYYSDWYMVFSDGIKEPSVSLASIFRNNGYYTIGTHPYLGWYYERDSVYKYFGFNEFKSIEFMEDATKQGLYVDDVYMTNEIIRNIENHEEPVFNMAITMQNHAPFSDGRFAPNDLIVKTDEKFEHLTQTLINTYVNTVYYTDLQLKRLIEYLENSDEPTIILFYGDHLPLLGDDYLVYRDTNYIDKDVILVDENLEMMSTPFILWSNYSNKSIDLGTINASYLPSIILNEMDMDAPEYMKDLYRLYETYPLFTRGFVWDADGNKYSSDDPIYEKLMKTFYVLFTSKDDTSSENPWLILDNDDFNKNYDMTKLKPDAEH